MLNHTKISTVSSAIIVSLFVQFLFVDYVIGFMTDSKHDRMMNNAVRREVAEKNTKARDLYMTRGNNDVIHRERDVTSKQVSSSSSPAPAPCPTDCRCFYPKHWRLILDCIGHIGHTNARSLSREINAYLPSVAWNITQLTIQYTSLTAVPESICQMKRLTQLALFFNRLITSLPDNCFIRLQQLKFFRASLCGLTSLQAGLFDNLANLQSVDLSHNKISSIDAYLFDNLTNLQRVDLSGNQISFIEAHLFDNLINLRSVDLSYNHISSIDVHLFDNSANLEGVRLSSNQISSIDAHQFDITANLPNLRYIDLSYNHLTEIDTWPVKRAQLINGSIIDLSNNHISRFTNSLGWHYDCNSPRLLSHLIDLTKNNITHLDDLFRGWNITGLFFCIHTARYRLVVSTTSPP